MKDLYRLLESIERKRTVGTLILGRRGRSCDLFVEEDQLFYAGREYSGRVDIDGLARGGFLNGRISPAVLEAAISGTNLCLKSLPESLMERGIIGQRERDELQLSHVCEEIFSCAFRHKESFVFQESQVPEHLLGDDPSKVSISIAAIIDLLKDREGLAGAIEAQIPSRKEVFVLTEKGIALQRSEAAELGLRRILELIDGFRTLNEVARDVLYFDFYVVRRLAESLEAGLIKKTVLPEIRDVSISRLEPEAASRLLPAFKLAVKHSIDEIGARERLAALHERVGNVEEAVIQYNFIGDALYRMRKTPRAMRAFQRALELKPEDPLITEKLVKTQQDSAAESLAEGRREVALSHLHAAVKLQPESVELTSALLMLHIESAEALDAMELCDFTLQRCRASGNLDLPARLLRTAAESFPDEPLFRRKLANLYLDFGRTGEAVIELEEIARREVSEGHLAKAREIWEKILRLDPDRDEVRRLLRHAHQHGRAPIRWPALRLTGLRGALVLLLAAAGYQLYTYLKFSGIDSPRVTHALAAEAASSPIAGPSPRERELLELADRAARFQDRYPLSLFVFRAGQKARACREEADRLGRDREQEKERILAGGLELLARGRQEEAVAELKRLQAAPETDPYRVRAEEGIRQAESYERGANQLKGEMEAALASGDWKSAHARGRRILEEHPRSKAAASLELPVMLRTIPPGAPIKLAGKALGASPQVVRLRPGKPVELEAEQEGYLPAQERIVPDAGAEQLVLLSRRPVWTAAAGGPLRFPPTFGQEQILAVREDGALVSFSSGNGRQSWLHPSPTLISPVAPPVEIGDQILLANNDGEILRFSRAGKITQRLKPSGLISTFLLARDGLPVFGLSTGALAAWDLQENRPLWSLPLKGAPTRLAAASGNQYLVAAEPGRAMRVDGGGGRIVWEAAIGDRIVSGPQELGGQIVLETAEHRLVILDGRTGIVLSRRTLRGSKQAAIIPSPGRILVLESAAPASGGAASGSGQLVEVEPDTAREIHRTDLPFPATHLLELGGGAGICLVGGGFIYVEAGNHEILWGFRPRAGSVATASSRGAEFALVTDAGEISFFR